MMRHDQPDNEEDTLVTATSNGQPTAKGKANPAAKMGWRVFAGLSAVLAAFAARKAAEGVWTMTTGKKPPDAPESPAIDWREALGWAALSGTVVTLARLVATRSAAQTWAKSTGAMPPGFKTGPQEPKAA
jgi:hypothetical protein